MATGTRLMQEISNQFLNCKICFENFRDPKTLSCLHTFCCACLQQQYDQEVSSRSTRYTISIYNRQVTCPLCRKKTDLPTGGVKRLPDNFLVSNLTEVLAKRTVSKVPPCDICSTVRAKNVDACSKCLDCSKILCKACVGLHLSTKVTQQHSLIDLEGEKDIQCKVHADEYVRFYCEPCDACICVVCAFQEHKDHEVCSFSDGSAKNRSNMETLLGKCKDRLGDVSVRLNAIEKYETVVKDVKERIRDLAINYISQVRAKEKELMKRIEDEYGGEIKEFIEQKQTLQENLDELQSTCNLTDIMLKDKGVELLLIKKDIEGKMNQLLQPVLPEVPSQPKYDLRFVPGEVALGRLSFDSKDNGIETSEVIAELIQLKRMKMEESISNTGCSPQTMEPDVITDTSQTEKGRTKEMSTSMCSDMRSGFSNTNSQTEPKSLVSRDTCTNQVETRERGVFAKVSDVKARGTMTERSDVRSLKCQTDQANANEIPGDLIKSSMGFQCENVRTREKHCKVSSAPCENTESTQVNTDQKVVKGLVDQTEGRDGTVAEMRQTTSRGDCRPAPDLLPTSAGLSAYAYTPGRKIRSIKIQTEISALDVEGAAVSTDMEFVNNIVQKQIVAMKLKEESENKFSRLRERPRRIRATDADDSCKSTNSHSHLVKATSTQSVAMSDKDTSTPIVTSESKVTWTDVLPTSDRATSTVGTKTQDRAIGTIPIKTGDMGVQIRPYSSAVSTNTTMVLSSDHDSQTTVETAEQGTMPDIEIEMQYAKKEKEVPKPSEVLESSVDFIPPPQLPVKKVTHTVDRATDPMKTPCFTKGTETTVVKTVTSSTETKNITFLDKETVTSEVKTVDQWTETHTPQLISTGVTPPVPATIDVGVATNVVLTDEQATCTDVKAYRNSCTETIIVVCDNETLTETTQFADAQTSMDVCTDNQECETDKMLNTDEGSMTDNTSTWETVASGSQATQCEPLLQRTMETNTTRKRKKPKETQTAFIPTICASCGHINQEEVGGGPVPPSSNVTGAGLECKLTGDLALSGKEFKDSSTMPVPLDTQDVGTMAISCVTCLHDFQETAIQTSHPKLYDKSSATSFELDLDFLERALSRDYQDAATSTESLPYIGLLSEIDVDELIVVPEAAFELVSDTDSEYELIMVDDETSTDMLSSVEAGTQTLVALEDGGGSPVASMTESTGSKGVGEIIKSLVQSHGYTVDRMHDSSDSKYFVSIGVNTTPKATFEKETCTPIRHLFSKGTMTFFVSKMDKSTSTLNQARIVTGSSITKIKSEDKDTMTTRAEQKNVGVETETRDMDGRITKCISKLRSVSEKLNSPPAKKATDNETFFGTNFTASKPAADLSDKTNSTISSSASSSAETPEEERQRQLKTLLEQTNALLKSKDRSPIRKPQPITTLKGRKPGTAEISALNPNTNLSVTCPNTVTLKPEDTVYDSKSLPRGFPSERPGTVRMGSQPLSPSRLPLLRYNSAPGRIATVPTQTLLNISSQGAPLLGPCASPSLSPSKIPISKKLSPPDYQVKQPQPQQQVPQSVETKAQEAAPVITPLRRPLPSITETRTPSSCSDSSTASYVSAESSASAGTSSKTDSTSPSAISNRVSTDSITAKIIPYHITSDTPASLNSGSNRISVDLTTTPSRSPSTSTSLSATSASLTDSVFKKSSSDLSHSAESSDTLEDKTQQDEKSISTPPKKSGMGFMQRLLSRKKKTPDIKKEQVSVLKAGPPTAAAVAALASAGPPLPAPAPESYAHTTLHHPPHHYPPLPEHNSPPQPRKPRPCVYVQQRLVAIQQDNVEEMQEKKAKLEDKAPDDEKEDQASGKDKKKEKLSEKQKEKSKKEAQAEKEKKKKEEKEKEKAKVKVMKIKTKKSDEKGQSPLPARKGGGATESGDKK